MTARPVPVPDELSAPYWTAAAEHALVIARCSRCGELSHPPGITCTRCRHPDPVFTFEPVGGAGTVRSWVVLRQSFLPGFEGDLPFVLVDVALDEDETVRLIGRLLDGVDTPLSIGERVVVAFEDIAPGVSVPAFTVAP